VLDSLAKLSDDDMVRIFWFAESATRDRFGKVAIAVAEALIADEQQSRDSSHWWRHGWSDVQTYHDGITIDAQAFDTLTNVFAKMLPDLPRQQNDAIFVKNVRDVYVATAPVFGLIAVRDQDSNAQRMRCGQLWQRMHLWATLHEFAMQPLNQMCETRRSRAATRIGACLWSCAVRSGRQQGLVWDNALPFTVSDSASVSQSSAILSRSFALDDSVEAPMPLGLPRSLRDRSVRAPSKRVIFKRYIWNNRQHRRLSWRSGAQSAIE
jgi:hypothetical protein